MQENIMLNYSNISLQEKVILEAALKLMFNSNIDGASITDIASQLATDEEKIEGFYNSNENLQIAAMEYAAVKWKDHVEYVLQQETDQDKTLKTIIDLFAYGSKDHPDSLSLYIDLWKRIRDNDKSGNYFERKTLAGIYEFYVDTFVSLVQQYSPNQPSRNELVQIGRILVAISDGLHIQSFLGSKNENYELLSSVLLRMLEAKNRV